jgi:hypothetical protein
LSRLVYCGIGDRNFEELTIDEAKEEDGKPIAMNLAGLFGNAAIISVTGTNL